MTTRYSYGHMRGIRIAALIGLVVTAFAVLTIPVLMIDAGSRSDEFWSRVIWSVILTSLVWIYIGGFFSHPASRGIEAKGIGGVLPGFGMVLFLYVGVSFMLMSLSVYFPTLTPLSLASNIFRATGLIVMSIFVYFSWAAGVVDTEMAPEGVLSPKDLVRLLQESEDATATAPSDFEYVGRSHNGDVSAANSSLKKLREKIEFSLPHSGRVGRNESYLAFSESVMLLCNDCKSIERLDGNQNKYSDIQVQAESLISQVGSISHNLRRV